MSRRPRREQFRLVGGMSPTKWPVRKVPPRSAKLCDSRMITWRWPLRRSPTQEGDGYQSFKLHSPRRNSCPRQRFVRHRRAPGMDPKPASSRFGTEMSSSANFLNRPMDVAIAVTRVSRNRTLCPIEINGGYSSRARQPSFLNGRRIRTRRQHRREPSGGVHLEQAQDFDFQVREHALRCCGSET